MSNILIAYYSRTGVTRKVATVLAERLDGAPVLELKETKDRGGVLGYIGAGKDALLHKKAKLVGYEQDLSAFDCVVICTPVWAFTASPPVLAFLEKERTALTTVAFIATMSAKGDKGAFKAMGEACGQDPVATLTLIDRAVKGDNPATMADLDRFAKDVVAAFA